MRGRCLPCPNRHPRFGCGYAALCPLCLRGETVSRSIHRLSTTVRRWCADMPQDPAYLAAEAQRKDSLMNVSITQNQPPTVEETSAKISVKLIVGIFFTLLGVLLTLDNLDLANADAILPYWPLVLVAIGILKFQERRSRTFAVIAIVAGAL